MDIHIREAIPEDAASIQDLNKMELGYSYPLDATAEKLRALLVSGRDKIFVAVVDDAVVGYVHLCDYDVLYAPHMKNIMGIAVSSRHRRKGIGRALLAQAEEWARSNGAAGIRLVSGGDRKDAHLFYRSCGYTGNKEQINFKKKF